MKTLLTLSVAALLVTAAFRAPRPQADEAAAKPVSCCLPGTDGAPASCEDHPGKPCLACIKKLEGSWYEADENGDATEVKMSEYRVTAGGSVVIETLFPGQDHEMVSMYYMEGEDLMLTHYCVLGNHPKLKASIDAESGQVVFSCSGAGENFASCQDTPHMHEGRITPVDEDHYTANWTPLNVPEESEGVEFKLVRGQ